MTMYRVHTEYDCSKEFTTLEEARGIFGLWKDNLMSDGVVVHESYVEIVKSDDDFEDYKVVEKVVAVRDHERMKISTPQEEGYEWDYWAKWQEVDSVEGRKILEDGSTVIRTEEGVYFHQLEGVSIPLLIDEEEGDRLFNS